MYMDNDIVASPRNGPVIGEPRIDPIQRKAALDAVIEFANTGRSGLTRLGDFSLAPARVDDGTTYFAQIRAVPKTGNRGCEFRFDIPAHRTNEPNMKLVASEVRATASAFLRLKGLTKFSKAARVLIDDCLEMAESAVIPVKFIALGVSTSADSTAMKLTVDIEMLGDDLKLGIDRVTTDDMDAMATELAELVAKHRRRDELRCLAMASRAIGWIDETALKVIDVAGLSFNRALDLATDSVEREFYFGDKLGDESVYDVSAALFWKDGIVRARVEHVRQGWWFSNDLLTMEVGGLPATMINAWTGHHFGTMVEHPFIPGQAIVTDVDQSYDKRLGIRLAIGTRLIDQGLAQPNDDVRIFA